MSKIGPSLESVCANCHDNCCKWGSLILLEGEWARIEALKFISSDDFKQRIARARERLTTRDGLQVLEKTPGEPCPFLSNDGKCEIYSRRPRDCRIWPLYYPSSVAISTLSVGPRCPATSSHELTAEFVQAAAREIQRTPSTLHQSLHQATVQDAYELKPLTVPDLSRGSFRVTRFADLRREMLLILLSILFGFALIEIIKTLLSLLPWIAIGFQWPKISLALVILLYFTLNGVRYVWAHVKLSAYTPLVPFGSRLGRAKAFVHDLMFPFQAIMFVAMALILTIPGVPVFSSLPPTPVRVDLLTRYFDTLVAGFLFFNLLLALTDLAWCKLMEKLLFKEPTNGREEVCTPPDLEVWRNSSAEEVALFSFSATLLLFATHLSLKDIFAHGGLVALSIIVALPWVTLVREFWGNFKPSLMADS